MSVTALPETNTGETMIPRVATVKTVTHKELRMPALDGFRGWAVLAVMFYHFALPFANEHNGMAQWATLRLMLTGSYGVDMFFVLSGFLITGILLDSKTSPRYFRTFYMRRVVRIFPLYYGVLAVCFGLLFWVPAFHVFVSKQAWLWFYGANFVHLAHFTFEPVFSHFWSLAIEEHFYFVWPLVVLLLPRRTLMFTAIALAFVSMALRMTLIAGGWFDAETSAMFTPCRLDGLVMGSFLAAVSRGPGGLVPHLRTAFWVATIGAIASILVKVLVGTTANSIWSMSGIGHFTVSAAFAGLLVIAVAGNGFWSLFLQMPFLKFLGKYSYGLYVFHYLLQTWMNPAFWYFKFSPFLSLIVHITAVTIVTIIAAWLSWHLYEKHFLRLKRLFEYEHRVPAKAHSVQ